jgi:hypothetical protein
LLSAEPEPLLQHLLFDLKLKDAIIIKEAPQFQGNIGLVDSHAQITVTAN